MESAAEKRVLAEKRRGARGHASRKVFEAEIAWPARTMHVSRERSFNNPDLPFIQEIGGGGGGGLRETSRIEERRRRVLMMVQEGEHRDRAQQPYIIT